MDYGSSDNYSSEPPDQSNEENEDRREDSSEHIDESNEENEDRRDDEDEQVNQAAAHAQPDDEVEAIGEGVYDEDEDEEYSDGDDDMPPNILVANGQ